MDLVTCLEPACGEGKLNSQRATEALLSTTDYAMQLLTLLPAFCSSCSGLSDWVLFLTLIHTGGNFLPLQDHGERDCSAPIKMESALISLLGRQVGGLLQQHHRDLLNYFPFPLGVLLRKRWNAVFMLHVAWSTLIELRGAWRNFVPFYWGGGCVHTYEWKGAVYFMGGNCPGSPKSCPGSPKSWGFEKPFYILKKYSWSTWIFKKMNRMWTFVFH